MASTRTPGITISGDGRRFIDKRYRGVRIGMRLGAMTQEQVNSVSQQKCSASISILLVPNIGDRDLPTAPRATCTSAVRRAPS